MARRKSHSLRTTLTVWFLFFSVVPLGFLTFYSIFKYRQSIESEFSLRGRSNIREFKSVIESYQSEFKVRAKRFYKNRELVYSLAASDVGRARSLVAKWVPEFNGSKISVIRDDGTFLFSALKEAGRPTKFYKILGEETYQLTDRVLGLLKNNEDDLFLLVVSGGFVQLIHNKRIYRSPGESVGYLEQVQILSNDYINEFAQRMNSKLLVLNSEKKVLASSDQELLGKVFFDLENPNSMQIKGVDHNLFFEKVNWGQDHFFVGLGVSKESSQRVVGEISFAFISAAIALIVLLFVIVYFTTQSILRPLNQLVVALEGLHEESSDLIQLPVSASTEVGRLTTSFNNMARKIHKGYIDRNEKIRELENANIEVRETQTQLVQSAKMASLGQLVAGVAHELNNPIGYISSNMSFLKDYVERLHQLIAAGGAGLEDKKKELDYDFIKEDLEKLIHTCEEGAQRTRDIVSGLRNFSRLEEMKLAPTDLNEGIENTLLILENELKRGIEVEKSLGTLPKVVCFASAINQVFMNVLQNSIHAIEGEGVVRISTEVQGSQVLIRISDTGKGMDEATLEKIFDPFFTTKGVGEGTGLGMSISFGIIRKHGGDIRVRSAVGEGSTFEILLPILGPEPT